MGADKGAGSQLRSDEWLSCCAPGLAGPYLSRQGDLRASSWCHRSFVYSSNKYLSSTCSTDLHEQKTNKTLPLCSVDSMGGG